MPRAFHAHSVASATAGSLASQDRNQPEEMEAPNERWTEKVVSSIRLTHLSKSAGYSEASGHQSSGPAKQSQAAHTSLKRVKPFRATV